MTVRPSLREIEKKLKEAKEAVENERYLPADPRKAAIDLERLDLWGGDVVKEALLQSLSEITPKDYEGRRPPEKSMETAVYGEEMFAFCWDSRWFSRKMYLKFCLKKGQLYYISFHESKQE